MKAFIFVALVASVAARSLDLETLRLAKQTPVVSKVGDELLLKEQLKKDLVLGQEKQQVLDTTTTDSKVFGGIYNKYDVDNTIVDVDRVLTLEELYSTPLFREYLSLPLFRQYIQYPSFQRFVSSIYFQRFYQLPAYKQYFVNPVLFYKYVYPIVQLFTTEYTLPSSYGQNEDVLGLQTLVDNVLLKNKNFLPYAYNYQNRFNVPTTTGYPFTSGTETNYKFILDKLYKNVVGQEIKTDVKLIPGQQIVEPFTNKVVVEDPKIVDVQVDQKIVPVVDTIVPVTTDKFDTVAITERDVLLFKELLRQQIITPEVYQAVIFGKINYTTVLRQVIARGGVSTDLLNTIISRLQVVDTTKVDSVVLPEHQLVILKDLYKQEIITPEVYQAVLYGKVEFTVLLRQVLERRGLNTDLINLIINKFVVVDFTFTEQDVLLVKELLKQHIITPEVYQAVIVGKLDFFTLLRQVIFRRDVIDTIIPFETTTEVLSERQLVILKDLYKQQIITQEIYEAVLYGKVDLVTILRQFLERRGLTTDLITLIINRLVYVDTAVPVTEQDVYLLKELLRQHIISQEIYQAVLFGKIDIYTILKQVIFRRDVVDQVVPYTSQNIYNRFQGKDRYFDLINKIYGYKNLYNTEYPTYRDNTYNYNRYPIVA